MAARSRSSCLSSARKMFHGENVASAKRKIIAYLLLYLHMIMIDFIVFTTTLASFLWTSLFVCFCFCLWHKGSGNWCEIVWCWRSYSRSYGILWSWAWWKNIHCETYQKPEWTLHSTLQNSCWEDCANCQRRRRNKNGGLKSLHVCSVIDISLTLYVLLYLCFLS